MNSDESTTDSVPKIGLPKDWQSVYSKISDWTIVVGIHGNDDYQATYHVHRFPLCTGPRKSIYFSTLFLTDLTLAETKSNTSHLLLADEKAAELFHHMLDFVYTGETPQIAPVDLAVLFSLADQYDIPSLKDKIQKSLSRKKTSMTFEEVISLLTETDQNLACKELCDLLVNGEFYDFTKLEDHHMEFIKPVWFNDIISTWSNPSDRVIRQLVPKCLVNNLADLDFDLLESILLKEVFFVEGCFGFSPENAVRMLYILQKCPKPEEHEEFDPEKLYDDFIDEITKSPAARVPIDNQHLEYRCRLKGDEHDSWELEVDLDEYADDESSRCDCEEESRLQLIKIRDECLKIVFQNRKELYKNEEMKTLFEAFDQKAYIDMLFNLPNDEP